MFVQISHHWWWLALRGITAILFGFIAAAWRADTLSSFLLLLGALALVDGLLSVVIALSKAVGKNRWWILSHGFISIAVAIISFLRTEFSAIVLLYGIAGWTMVTGILEMVGARKLRRNISNEWLLTLSGAASIIFAFLVVLLPNVGDLSLAGTVAVSTILFGLLTLALSLNLRSVGKYLHAMLRSG